MANPAKEIEALRASIRHHDHLYYVEGRTEISDSEYDKLFDRLKALEAAHPELITPDSPTQRVAGEPIAGFKHVAHAVPMMSIDNTYSEADLRDFDGRVAKGLEGQKYTYLVDPKVDGVSANLRYERGRLVLGATRGDGRTGDDITSNIRTIRSVPLALSGKGWPDVLEVRGEVYWPRKAFDAFNAAREKAGEEPFANPRNATTGALKSLDSAETASRGLAFLAHGHGEITDEPFDTFADFFDRLANWGVPVSPHRRVCKTIDEVAKFVTEWETRRHKLEYETDGLVIKVNELRHRDTLGTTSRYPRWCIAYKYAAEQAETELLNIDLQVGKLGTITPRAVMKPVQLSGTTVKHASLHNFDQVARLDVRIGDIVVVEKAGEIIPQVIRVAKPKSPRGPEFKPPKKCPVCKGEVVQDEGGVYIRCINPSCDAQIKERLVYFCGRDQMHIEGLGEAWIEKLVDSGTVHTFADLYLLENRIDQLAALTIEKEYGMVKTDELLKSIDESKNDRLSKQLPRLRIKGVDRIALSRIEAAFDNIVSFSQCDAKTLIKQASINSRDAQLVFDRLAPSPEKRVDVIAELVGPKGLKFSGAGKVLVKNLIDNRIVERLSDFYSLRSHRNQIAAMKLESVLGRSKAKAIIKSLGESKKHPFSRVLASLNIRHVGSSTAEVLAEHFGSMDALAAAAVLAPSPSEGEGRGEGDENAGAPAAKKKSNRTKKSADDSPALFADADDSLQAVDGIGPEVSRSLRQFFTSDAGRKTWQSLRDAGVNMIQPRQQRTGPQVLAGKTLLVTGTILGYKRNQVEDLIKQHGGTVTSSVSKKTDYLIVGDDPGSKLDKAKSLGVKTLDIDQFLQMLK